MGTTQREIDDIWTLLPPAQWIGPKSDRLLGPPGPRGRSSRAADAAEHRSRESLDEGHQPAWISAKEVSIIRFENPHSLSYHEQTLTSLPSITRVRPAS